MPKKTKKQKMRAEAHRNESASDLIFTFKSADTVPQVKTIAAPQSAGLLRSDIRKSVVIGFLFIAAELLLSFISK